MIPCTDFVYLCCQYNNNNGRNINITKCYFVWIYIKLFWPIVKFMSIILLYTISVIVVSIKFNSAVIILVDLAYFLCRFRHYHCTVPIFIAKAKGAVVIIIMIMLTGAFCEIRRAQYYRYYII